MRRFNVWFGGKVNTLGLDESVDYLAHVDVHQVPHRGGMRGREHDDAIVTVHTGYRVSMTRKGLIGKQVQLYFIACQLQYFPTRKISGLPRWLWYSRRALVASA